MHTPQISTAAGSDDRHPVNIRRQRARSLPGEQVGRRARSIEPNLDRSVGYALYVQDNAKIDPPVWHGGFRLPHWQRALLPDGDTVQRSASSSKQYGPTFTSADPVPGRNGG